MKKYILLTAAGACAAGAMAFALQPVENNCAVVDEAPKAEFSLFLADSNRPVSNFYYKVDPRFMLTVTSQELQNATSIVDFLSDQCADVVSFDSISVIELDNYDNQARVAVANNRLLSNEQLDIIHAARISTNLLVKAYYQTKAGCGQGLVSRYMTPHMTVVPEKQATYTAGKHELIQYLKSQSADAILVAHEGELKPAKLFFTVSNTGSVTDVTPVTSCGIPSIDDHMVQLMNNVPGQWEAAENAEGEKVAQTLVFFYGVGGC